jgi:hypothetical protein
VITRERAWASLEWSRLLVSRWMRTWVRARATVRVRVRVGG